MKALRFLLLAAAMLCTVATATQAQYESGQQAPATSIKLKRHQHRPLLSAPKHRHAALHPSAPAAVRATYLASLPEDHELHIAASQQNQQQVAAPRTLYVDTSAFADLIASHAAARVAASAQPEVATADPANTQSASEFDASFFEERTAHQAYVQQDIATTPAPASATPAQQTTTQATSTQQQSGASQTAAGLSARARAPAPIAGAKAVPWKPSADDVNLARGGARAAANAAVAHPAPAATQAASEFDAARFELGAWAQLDLGTRSNVLVPSPASAAADAVLGGSLGGPTVVQSSSEIAEQQEEEPVVSQVGQPKAQDIDADRLQLHVPMSQTPVKNGQQVDQEAPTIATATPVSRRLLHTRGGLLATRPSMFHASTSSSSSSQEGASPTSASDAGAGATGPSQPAGTPVIAIPLTDYHSVMYTGEMSLGTPGQNFDVIMDTGSSCLWVMSSNGGQSGGKNSAVRQVQKSYMHYYHSEKSSTYQPAVLDASLGNAEGAWSIQYGVGTAQGFLSNDTIQLGPAIATGQVFAEAVSFSGNFLNKQQPMDGILGLSFPSGACSGFPNVLTNLRDHGAVQSRVFGFYLDHASNADVSLSAPGAHDRSVLVLGDPSKAPADGSIASYASGGELTYTPVLAGKNPPSMWFVKLESIRVVPSGSSSSGSTWSSNKGNQGVTLCSSLVSSPCAALPDSGTSFLTVPASLFTLLVNAITDGRQDCVMDTNQNVFCLDGAAGLPDMEFTFEGRKFVLRGKDYILPNAQLAVQLMDFDVQGVDIVILGDMFLRRVYTVFDMDQARVGFGNAVELDLTPTKTFVILGAVGLTALLVLSLAACYWTQQGSNASRARGDGYDELPIAQTPAIDGKPRKETVRMQKVY